MPLHRRFSFVAVDEIQLCADWERGHIFTDRLLNARGTFETVFMGADTIRPLLRELVPEAEIVSRPRLSRLTYLGTARLDRLPRRSAVVAFTAADVYALAEILRRRRGGAAVVLGALSPRTRNAQVAMYQAGEVEHLVATDAIGMGLNMDLAHVAFAQLRKFDGRRVRGLTAPELAQIAGRAGRYTRDGTFGVTNGLGDLDPRTVRAVEEHGFPPLRFLYWRNSDLEFTSLDALIRSLDAEPPHPGLVRVRDALDDRSLLLLARREDVRKIADSPERVRLLWEVCQIPDYRKTLAEAHLRLLETVYLHLTGPTGRLPKDWVARMIARLDRTDGDIDTLVARIAHIRTWSYLSHRSDWLDDAVEFQQRSRAVEDRLSDALHERLTQRFVDRRTTALLRRLRETGDLPGEVDPDGGVFVDGHRLGRIEGLRFFAEPGSGELEQRALARAARRVVHRELTRRAEALGAPEAELVREGALVRWQGEAVAEIRRGADPLRPRIAPLAGPDLDSALAQRIRQRLEEWLEGELAPVRAPLFALEALAEAPDAPAPVRAVAWRLVEGLGSAPAAELQPVVRGLDAAGRRTLARLGVRFGRLRAYVAPLLRPRALELRAFLLCLWHGVELPVPPAGCTVLRPLPADGARVHLPDLGFLPLADVALRVDVAERLAQRLRALAREGPFAAPAELAAEAGLSREELLRVIPALGFRRVVREGRELFVRPKERRATRRRRGDGSAPASSSPFAVLLEAVTRR
ncbi:hypothetical protein HRbin39_01716 [bacterium HR39]|nr:hypothetical protein HRbin39_01716 [bacterium HR39]